MVRTTHGSIIRSLQDTCVCFFPSRSHSCVFLFLFFFSFFFKSAKMSFPKNASHGCGVISNFTIKTFLRLGWACSVYTSRVYQYDTRGVLGGRTQLTEVSGTGIEFVPNLTGVFGRVLRPYRTVPKTCVGYSPTKHPRYSLVRPQHP